ncbi:CHASE4 domain-containing protein [Microvirga sp. GCM10011540]|uniref:CHASE4 domain-containing protein n=1 Tax=Microvirga sp. GCM10011540 TaxID=3317338 RepID=UPI003612AFED
MSLSSTRYPDRQFRSRVVLPVTAVTVASLALAAFALFWAVRQSNDLSVERQLRTTERHIRAIVGELAQQQEMVAVWDDALQELEKPAPDWQWIDDNIGIWLHLTFGQDQVYLLDAANAPIYATIGGKRASPREFNLLRPSLEGLLHGLRGHSESPHRPHVLRPPDTTYVTTGRAEYDAHLLELLGRPAAVSVMKIVPHSDNMARRPGSEFILVSVRFLDGDFLKRLSERNLIEGLRFSRSDTPRADETSVELRSDEGYLIGYFIWQPDLPGTRILHVIGPSTALVCGLMIAVMALLVRSLRRSILEVDTSVERGFPGEPAEVSHPQP